MALVPRSPSKCLITSKFNISKLIILNNSGGPQFTPTSMTFPTLTPYLSNWESVVYFVVISRFLRRKCGFIFLIFIYIFTYLAASGLSCRTQELWSSLQYVGFFSFSMWDPVPWTRIESGPQHRELRVLATGPPGKFWKCGLKNSKTEIPTPSYDGITGAQNTLPS